MYAEAERLAREAAATTWTSSPTPSGPPTGGATTTSPSRSSSRWRMERYPVPDVDRRRGRHRRHLGDDRALPPLPPPPHQADRRRPGELGLLRRLGRPTPPTTPPGCRRASRGSAGRGWSRASSPAVIDLMIPVPDAASIATMRWHLQRRTGPLGSAARRAPTCGASLGWSARDARGRHAGQRRHAAVRRRRALPHTYYDDGWVSEKGMDLAPYASALADYERTGVLVDPS